MGFDWQLFDAQPIPIKELGWDFNEAVPFLVRPNEARAIAETIRKDILAKHRRNRRAPRKFVSFARFVPKREAK